MKTSRVIAVGLAALMIVGVVFAANAQAQNRARGYGGNRLVVKASGAPGLTAENRRAYQKLERTVVSFTFTEQPLAEALDFLSTLGGVNIVLDRKFADEGKTVTLKLNNVTLETALRFVTEQVDLKYIVRDGLIYISDEEGTTQEPVTVVYDVNDLLTTLPDFKGPTMQLSNLNNNNSNSSTSGSNSSSIFDTGNTDSTNNDNNGEEAGKTREEMLKDLVDLIQQVIEPGTWDTTP